MPVAKKEARKGTQLLVEGDLLNRARALAVVREVSVAQVWRDAIDLSGQEGEEQWGSGLETLHATLADLAECDEPAALEWMVRHGFNLADLQDSEELRSKLREALA